MDLPENQNRPLNIAHRGARSLAPENTLAAARKGLEVGADMWELDIQMTADEELIVIHDSTLKRTSNVREVFPSRKPWLVHEFTLDEIRLLDFGTWFTEQDPFGQIAAGMVAESDLASYVQQQAPTLGEALSFTLEHGWSVNLEIKDLSGNPDPDQVAPKVLALVEDLDMVDSVLISSYNQNYLAQIRKAHPHIATGVLVSKPHPHPETLLRQLGAQAYHPRLSAFRPTDIALLHPQGCRVHIWNVNDRKTMKRLVRTGVDGIFTDFPQLLTSVLASCGRDKKR
ncbi:MAG: glycerophosphodiester phosphodiesterase family protein [Deltaproteobacteria bacterium]|nr:glycerophosphodiester phosphodiesterase family protein [Deltaproteobacteria bacterium]